MRKQEYFPRILPSVILCTNYSDILNNIKVDDEHCEKTFPSHSDFLDGIFSIGCCCPLAITYGFELIMGRESAQHIFRFLMCRKINFEKLDGIIEDFACGLQPYALNREPEEFKFTRFLVVGG